MRELRCLRDPNHWISDIFGQFVRCALHSRHLKVKQLQKIALGGEVVKFRILKRARALEHL
jgi:hypothetical protein